MRSARRHRLAAVAAIVTALLAMFAVCGCSTSSSASSQLTVAGSTTVLPIAEIAAERYEQTSGVHVLVSGLGSSAGIEAAINGTADIASSSRDLTAQESTSGLVPTVIAHDGIAVIVNEDNPVDNVSLDELRAIYSGKITNWSQLGGPDLVIQLVNRDEASGTREAFRTIVMGTASFDGAAAVLPGTGQVRDVVSRTPGAIGYISIGFVTSDYATTKVKPLSVDGISANEQTVEAGTYPISRDLYFFTKGAPSGSAASFIAFVTSEEMAQTIRDAGYIPVTADAKGKSSASTASAAGTSDATTTSGSGDAA